VSERDSTMGGAVFPFPSRWLKVHTLPASCLIDCCRSREWGNGASRRQRRCPRCAASCFLRPETQPCSYAPNPGRNFMVACPHRSTARSEQMNIVQDFAEASQKFTWPGVTACRSGPHVRCQCHNYRRPPGSPRHCRRYRKSSVVAALVCATRGSIALMATTMVRTRREPCVLLAGSD